jgi:glyoxylase-like metal-dependent hydrolase (beta-lactamase superfamily II)
VTELLRWTVGDLLVTQVVELEAQLPLEVLFPGADHARLEGKDWLRPFFDANGFARLGINSYLVRTPTLNIVVDCCAGNNKPRAGPPFAMLETSYLEDLAAAGFPAEDVDIVVCTHLHTDHIGWNTTLVDGKWVPTFPNARYLIGATEFEFWRDQDSSPDDHNAFEDSIQPVADAGLLDLVGPDHEITDGIRLIPTPGHTIGHLSVRLHSAGEEALITGDMIHHPAQFAHPEWACFLDYDPQQSSDVRRAVFQQAAASDQLLIGTHFVAPSAGYLTPDADGWSFRS